MKGRAFVVLGVVLVMGCRAAPGTTEPDPQLHVLTLPDIPAPEVPDAPGRPMFVGACTTCHTTRYVLDQPALPRRTWAAEVDKMRRVYGATVPDELVAPIVDYLVAVRGTAG